MLLYFLIGCAEVGDKYGLIIDGGSDASRSNESIDTGRDSFSNEALADGMVDTIDEYVAVYCSEYALPCGLYETAEECYALLYDNWNEACEVADTNALDVCARWIAELDCDSLSWNDQCDQAFECK